MRYISKGEWFDKGTEAELIEDYRIFDMRGRCCGWRGGLFRGLRNGKVDKEICNFAEFETLEDE